MPGTILDLTVGTEPLPRGIADVRHSLVSEVGLFSLRAGEQLAATLQVGRFENQDSGADPEVQAAVLEQVGATRPVPAVVGETRTWLTVSTEQVLAVWFDRDYMFVLSVRPEFDRPRALIRAAAEIDPEA